MEAGATGASMKMTMMMLDGPIGGIDPELNQRMRVRAFGSSPVIGGKE